MQIWRDYKFKVKKKIVTNKVECKGTKQLILSPLEEAVANLLQFQKQINPEGMVQGVPNIKCEPLDIDDSADFDVLNELQMVIHIDNISILTCNPLKFHYLQERTSANSNEAVTTTSNTTTSNSSVLKQNPLKRKRSFLPKNSKIPTKRHELLQRHSNEQARLLQEISNSISSIKLSLSDMKDIEEKRLKLELDKNKREEEMYKINIKIKRIELSIKQQELNLLNNEISD